jgi:gliding motility-associated-like protein
MKRFLTLVLALLCIGYSSYTKAQCYGVVHFDKAATAGTNANAGNTTFTITTANANELIMIAYDGWNGPGSGPVTVDGNPATLVSSATNGNSGSAVTYAYVAPTAAVHTIVCATTGYNSGYYINMAAAFYVTGTCTPLSIASLFSTQNTIPCTTGGSVNTSITTTIPNAMIFTNCEINEGQPTTYPISWTNATFLGNEHTEDGIDASEGYATAAVAGAYSITATNSSPPANGCGGLCLILTAIQPPLCSSITLTTTQVNPACGNNNGSATVTASSGTAPYTYSWNPGGNTNSNATGLTAGSYTVTVTDHNGCSATASVTLVATAGVTANITASTNIKCNGGATGSATVTAGSGTAPYTYSWTPGGNTNSNATGLTAGSYTVTVTDKNGCTATTSVTLTQPTALTLTLANTPVKCNGGATGSGTATAGGGTPAYTYAWAPGGSTNSNATGLTAGTYTCTVTDANGCTITASTTITQPAVLTAAVTNTSVKCNGGTGTATVTAGGGTTNYTYLWTPGSSTNSNATGLTAGTYTITVTDANGCTKTASTTITQPTVLSATTATTAATCGNSDGTANVTANGGTTNYTYLWSPGGSTASTISGLSAGSYTITVTDANGCIVTASANVGNAASETITITGSTDISCNGGANGSVTTNTVGGTTPYTYAWTPSGQTTANVTGLTAGSYTVTVKDANGCISLASIILTQPPALTGLVTNTPVLCNGGTGTATITAGGGTPAYTYAWTPGGNSNSAATGLSAGTYTVTLTDAHGCSFTASTTITQPTALTATGTSTTATCSNSNGTVTVTPGGGSPGYNYLWTPGGYTNANVTGLSTGTYSVTVTDANGCTLSTTATVGNAASETITITGSINILCSGGTNGSIFTTTTGGTTPYTYIWNPSGQTTANASGLSAGSYTVTVNDANGCISTASVTLTQPPLLTVTTGAPTNVLCNATATGSDVATAGGGAGGYSYSWTPGGQTSSTATGLSAGTYTVTVTDANGCSATASTTITQPTALTVTTGAPVNVKCNGGTNGSDVATPAGGTGIYTYSWTTVPVQTTFNATGLSAGTYTVTVTDANGCTATASVTVTQPALLTVTTTTTTSTCGNANGTATAAPTGGTGPYGYSWTTIPVQNTATANGLSAGTYTVTVTDANGCTATASATVTNLNGETVGINPPVNVSCNGGNNGSAIPTVIGGTTPYTYLWSNAQTNATATGLTAGSYTLVVTDANGCIATASVTVTQPTLLTVVTGTPTNVFCNATATGTDNATAGGGTTPYTYSWNTIPVQTTSNATGLSAGTYTITVTDANGCTATASTTITQPPALTLTSAGFPTTCNGGNDGQATVIPAGGTPGYTYLWSNANTRANIIGLTAGTYNVTVTDANGCTATASVTVTEPPPILVAFNADTVNGCSPLCTGLVDGSSDPNGTITSWNWVYSDGGTDTGKAPRHCFNMPGNYTVSLTVTDNHGCNSMLTINNLITVYSHPVASFAFSPQPTTIMTPTITFKDQSTDAYGILAWVWNFSDPYSDSSSVLQNPTHTYSDSGTYCPTLTVTNVHGCVDSITECLVISPEYTLYIPNAFSPNGDGVNDIFQPRGEDMESFEMYIFDRWGMLIYKTNDINKGWNGGVNNNSKICEEDTYVYTIHTVDTHGKKHSYIGKVTLIQ